jgi:hypothetical protein
MRKSKYFSPPIFDNNTQLYEQKILSTHFNFFVEPYDLGPREKKRGGLYIWGLAPHTPLPPPNKGMLDNGHPYFAREF